nr:immunoglobulin heavy chain junction region [Macaca mulatta]MOY22679.1 immunoglobulin heavy chain junction region [Macaca mulatta]MOY23680.1 immunoglobulin heavy chain junction region [Macaca mulatta]MOY26253.1 immunoglobulin heavy chain junction region [Macaca mulatta]MOY26771.1 immunoglobulin heavy chain junction region [Macaca mulatta]
CARGGGYFDSW